MIPGSTVFVKQIRPAGESSGTLSVIRFRKNFCIGSVLETCTHEFEAPEYFVK